MTTKPGNKRKRRESSTERIRKLTEEALALRCKVAEQAREIFQLRALVDRLYARSAPPTPPEPDAFDRLARVVEVICPRP